MRENPYSGILAVLIDASLKVILPYSIRSKVDTTTLVVGPAYLPKLVIYGMVLYGICLLLTNLVLKKDGTLEVEIRRKGHTVPYSVLLLFYMLAMKHTGLLIASAIFSAVFVWMMEDRDWGHHLSAELLMTATFVPFKHGLYITLPTIIL